MIPRACEDAPPHIGRQEALLMEWRGGPGAAAHLMSLGHVTVIAVKVANPPAQAATATRKPSAACTRGRSCGAHKRAVCNQPVD